MQNKKTIEKVSKGNSTKGKVIAAKNKIKIRSFGEGRVYIACSYNNIILTLTDTQGNVLAWATSGNIGFRGSKKATPFAAAKVAEALTQKAQKTGITKIRVFIRGIGGKRDSSIRSLASNGFDILSIKDITPIPHNGCRPKKARRV